MATPAQLLSQIAAGVESQISGISRLASDYRDDLEVIAAGADRYQLRGGPTGKLHDSNESRTVEHVELFILHRLGAAETERAYTEDELQTNIEAFIAPTFWRGFAACYELESDIEYGVERVGSVLTVSLTVDLSITP